MYKEATNNGVPVFVQLSKDRLSSLIGQRMMLQRQTDTGDGPREFCSPDLLSHAYADPHHLPVTPRIKRAPTYNADQVLLTEPGWHGEDGVFLATEGIDLHLSDNISKEEMEEAVQFVKSDLLADFPFMDAAGKRGPAETHYLALLLTIAIRDAIPGPSPIFAMLKNAPGAGASLGANVPSILFQNKEMQPDHIPNSPDEHQKMYVGFALDAERLLVFHDNVSHVFQPIILANVTAGEIGGRILGTNKIATRKNDLVIIITGINTALNPEMLRRACLIPMRLDDADLSKRTFKHKDLKRHLFENRAPYLTAIFTMVEYWLQSGAPYGEKVLPSFERWSQIVGGILKICGVEGFLEVAPPQVRDSVEDAEMNFLAAWWEDHCATPVRTSTLLLIAQQHVDAYTEAKGRAMARMMLNRLLNAPKQVGGAIRRVVRDGDLWRLEFMSDLPESDAK